MADTIRERIIQNIMARLSLIRTANGYLTNAGAYVYRVRKRLSEDELPGCVVYPRTEDGEVIYGRQVCDMPVDVEAAAIFGETNPSIVAEQLLGDLIDALIGTNQFVTPAASLVNDKVDVATSAWYLSGVLKPVVAGTDLVCLRGVALDTHRINSITVTSAGALSVVSGTDGTEFSTTRAVAGGPPTIPTGSREIAQVRFTSVTPGPVLSSEIFQNTDATDGLAGSIQYVSGGSPEYPEEGDLSVGVTVRVMVKYETLKGNPFTQ